VGRAAQGRPWIFREIAALLAGVPATTPTPAEVRDIMLTHLRDLYDFYGAEAGVRIARKHIGWYCNGRPHAQAFRQSVMQTTDADAQLAQVRKYFDRLGESAASQAA
jgi:tRNA-dihydrouridine synthase B